MGLSLVGGRSVLVLLVVELLVVLLVELLVVVELGFLISVCGEQDIKIV